MARFGQGVNASLGKTDYSNYLEGALQGARGVAAGGQAIGQGIASGIEKYGENKKQNSAMEGGIKTAQSNLEGMLKFEGLGEGAKKTITDTLAQLNDPTKSVSERNAIAQQATNSAVNLINMGQGLREKQQAENERIATNQSIREFLSTGQLPEGGLSPMAINAISGYMNAQANQAKANATSTTEGRKISKEEYDQLKKSGIKYKAVPLQDGSYLVKEESGKLQSSQTSEPAFNQAAGTAGFKNAEIIYNKAYKAVDNLEKIDRTTELVEKGDPNTGLIAELKTNIQRAIAVFSDDPKIIEQLSDTELLKAALGSEVFKAIGELGIGARGIDTPAERDFLREVLAGKETLNKRTILEMLRIRRDQGAKDIERFNSDVDDGLFDDFFEAGKTFRRGKIEMPSRGNNEEDAEPKGTDLGGGFSLITEDQ